MIQWKKRGVLVLILSMLFLGPYPGWLTLGGTVHAAMDGDGSPGNPYRITTADDLDEIRNVTVTEDTYFVLMNDIDLNVYPSWEPIPDFAGHLNGNGNTISNLKIDTPSNNVGLFANLLSGATVYNLNIANADVKGNDQVGILVGSNVGQTDNNIQNVTVTGTVYGGNMVGGLMGRADNIAISNSHANVDVTGQGNIVGGLVGTIFNHSVTDPLILIHNYAEGTVTGVDNVGGLFGAAFGVDITGSYASVDVSGGSRVGGLVGGLSMRAITESYAMGKVTASGNQVGGLVGQIVSGDVTFSYATGEVTGISNIGGLVGENSSGTITNSYYDLNSSGQFDDGKGTKLTTEQMKDSDNYDGWDFNLIWNIDQHHSGYPYLVGMQGMQSFLTYMGNDSNDHSELYSSRSYTLGTSVIIEDPNWTRVGYRFQGWNTAPDGSGTQYEVGVTVPLNSNLLLYAVWSTLESGDGSSESPYQIATAQQLNEMRNHPDKHFILMNDIDLSTHPDTVEWEPIPDFAGHLDGNHKIIANLKIDGSTRSSLFERLLTGARIENLEIDDAEVIGTSNSGILSGQSVGSTIHNVKVSGTVNANSGLNLGGLIGHASNTTISNSHANVVVTNIHGTHTGGLIGYAMNSEISESYTTGHVTGISEVGGLIGYATNIEISKSHATSRVSGSTSANSYRIGGLIGYAVNPKISESYATGEIMGTYNLGGLVGQFRGSTSTPLDSYITKSYATGDVTATEIFSAFGIGGVGGLVGYFTGEPSHAHLSYVTESYATGSINGHENTGGLIGYALNSEISESHAMGNVTGSGNEGGLVGSISHGEVTLSYATGEVTGTKNTGGLIGVLSNNSTVIHSYSTSHVIGDVDAGGLVGGNRSGHVISSFATGTVSGCDDIGGLVGDNDLGGITNSYTAANVTGICGIGNSNSIGGLVGDNSGTIENSFVIGSVNGHDNVGGLVGDDGSGSITNSYYDINLTGQPNYNGQGLTSEQMKNTDNYDGWDFINTWKVDQHHDRYPYLVGTQSMQVFLTYIGNDSNDESGLYESNSYTIGTSVTIEDLNWTRAGHLFQGWNTESDGSGTVYEIGDTIHLTSNLLLHAIWTQTDAGSSSGSSRSNNATMANLEIFSDGEKLTLSPEFVSGQTTSYRAETTSSEVTIKATPSNAWATVTLDEKVLDGEKTVALEEGDNLLELVVTAENGAVRTYSLTIHRVVEKEDVPTVPEVPGASACPFHDVTGHWAESSICDAFDLGIVNGHSDIRFSPQSDITRVEFAAMLLRTMGMTTTSSLDEQSFTDQDQIPAWAISTVSAAVEHDILNGYTDQSLRPLNSVSRAEMVTMMGRAMKWVPQQKSTTFIDDADIPEWAKGYIQEAVQQGLVNGREGNRFSPSDSATRAEATVLLIRLWYALGDSSSE